MIDLTNLIRVLSEREASYYDFVSFFLCLRFLSRPIERTYFAPFVGCSVWMPLGVSVGTAQKVSSDKWLTGVCRELFTFFHVVHKSLFPLSG